MAEVVSFTIAPAPMAAGSIRLATSTPESTQRPKSFNSTPPRRTQAPITLVFTEQSIDIGARRACRVPTALLDPDPARERWRRVGPGTDPGSPVVARLLDITPHVASNRVAPEKVDFTGENHSNAGVRVSDVTEKQPESCDDAR
ncbi:hypothetical protein GCM10027444_43310 [Actinopolyspora lacussalsi]